MQVAGELDIEEDESFQQILIHVMRVYSPRLLLDLADVSAMDCAGLHALLMTRRRAEMRKGSVRIVAASATVRRIITVSGMKDIFPVRVSGETAPGVNREGFRLIADLGCVYP